MGKSAALGGIATLFFSCLDPTQITVEIKSNIVCGDINDVLIATGVLSALETAEASATTTHCGGTLVLVPSASREAVAVRVVAGLGKKTAQECVRDRYMGGCIVARRAVNYISHTKLRLPIELDTLCVDVPCEATTTCYRGSCVPAMIDDCDPKAGCVPNADGGTAADAGDAGPAFVQRSVSGTSDDLVMSIALDNASNVYVSGLFGTSADFGGGARTGVAGNAFVASYEPSSLGYRWDYVTSGSAMSDAKSIVMAPSGPYFGGTTYGAIQFKNQPQMGVMGSQAYAGLLDLQGGYKRSYTLGGPNDLGHAVTADTQGNEYLAGTCNPPTIVNGSTCSVGDVFIRGYNANGQTRWERLITGQGSDSLGALATDGTHVFAAGAADFPVDFGGGFVMTKGGLDAYVASYKATDGALEWVHVFGDQNYQMARSLAVRGSALYVLGQFAGTISMGMFAVTAALQDVYLLKLDASTGKPDYLKKYGGPGIDGPGGLWISSTNDVALCGAFEFTADFGAGPVTASNGKGLFVVGLDQNGTYVSSRTVIGSNHVICQGLALTPSSLFMVGSFVGTVSFDGPPLTSAGMSDGFIVKLAK